MHTYRFLHLHLCACASCVYAHSYEFIYLFYNVSDIILFAKCVQEFHWDGKYDCRILFSGNCVQRLKISEL